MESVLTADAFYVQHQRRVRAVISTKVPTDDVADVAAEVWVKVTRYFEQAKPTRQWLNAIIRSAVADYYRGVYRHPPTVPLSLCDEGDAVDTADLLDGLLVEARKRRVRAVVNACKAEARPVLLSALRSLGNRSLSPAERQALHRFRQRLAASEAEEEGVTS